MLGAIIAFATTLALGVGDAADRMRRTAASCWIAGALSAVIQSSPAGLSSRSMRACVIIPRSPTTTTRLSPKRSLSLVIGDLTTKRQRIAFEHLDCDRTSLGRAQKPEHDLHLVVAAVPRMAKARQLAAASLDIARTHVIEHQGSVAQVPTRQSRLDRRLCRAQPVERGVDFLGADRAHPKRHSERVDCRRSHQVLVP